MTDHRPRQSSHATPALVAARARTFLGRSYRNKFLRWLLLGVLAAGTAAVVAIYRRRPRPAAPRLVAPHALPAGARQELAGFSYTRNEGGHPVFTVRANRSVDFKNGEGTTLDGVEVEMFGRAGDQHNLLRTQSCRYDSISGNFSCLGQVEIELDAPSSAASQRGATPAASVHGRQPVYLETTGLSYNQQSALLSSASRVRWRYGTASGEAVGLTYSTENGTLGLEHEVTAGLPVEEFRGPSGRQAPALLHLRAERLNYSKVDQKIELAGPVQLTEDNREISADRATLRLDARNRLTSAFMEGAVRAQDRSPASPLTAGAGVLEAVFDPATSELKSLKGSGGVEALSGPGSKGATNRLTADRIQVSFEGPHFHPGEGLASGSVRVSVEPAVARAEAGSSPAPQSPAGSGPSQASLRREELETSELKVAFRPANGGFDHAQTLGPGRLLLIPAGTTEGRRVVTAGQFLMAFDTLGRLKSVQGKAPTRIVFEPRPGSPPGGAIPETRAENLQALLDPASAALVQVEQAGRFEFLDGGRRADADRGLYSAGGQLLTLTGKPVVTDPDTRMRADRFLVHLATRTAEGIGHVASTHFGPWREGLAAAPQSGSSNGSPTAFADASGARKTGPSTVTTNVLADRVFADRSLEYVRYEGHVRAWQGSDVLESPSLDIYRAERRVVTGAGVVTSDLAPSPPKRQVEADAKPSKPSLRPVDSTAPGSATEPVTIRADRLEYFDFGRKAAYRGHVRMNASGATLEADRLDAYFTQGAPRGDSELDRAVADGRVKVVEPGRRADADHAEYFAASGKVVLTGGPPTLYDSTQGFATGRSLTFFIHDDTLLVDGGSGTRALSKHHLSP